MCECVCTFGIWFLVSISNINQSFELLVLLLLPLLLFYVCMCLCAFFLCPSLSLSCAIVLALLRLVSFAFHLVFMFCMLGFVVVFIIILISFSSFVHFHPFPNELSMFFPLVKHKCDLMNAPRWIASVCAFVLLTLLFRSFFLFCLLCFARLFVCNFFFFYFLVLFGQMLMI